MIYYIRMMEKTRIPATIYGYIFDSIMRFWKRLKFEKNLVKIPQNWVDAHDDETVKKMNRILDLLDDDDDVQNVYHNWDE